MQKLVAEKIIEKKYAIEIETLFKAELQSYLDEAVTVESIESQNLCSWAHGRVYGK